MIITDWTFIKQEIKITQDLLTFHPPQDKLMPVMSFYTFLMHIPFWIIVPHLLQTHTAWSISSEYLFYMRIIGVHSLCSNQEEERLKIIFVRTRLLYFHFFWFYIYNSGLHYARQNKNTLFSDRRETIMSVGYENILSQRNYLASDD